MIKLYPYQKEAVSRMKNGCILCGGVGSGKSITSLYYYMRTCGDRNLYIITTARKRDDNEWKEECEKIGVSAIVDSWNNIKKYINVKDSFFIFDEQRVVGKGVWVKSFLTICKHNQWILLSATPGDTWSDYIPVFVANGFYRNRTEFNARHVVFSRFTKFPQIERYVDQGPLLRHRRDILVDMDYIRPTERIEKTYTVLYDPKAYKRLYKERFNYETNKPIKNVSELCQSLRKVVNSDESRINQVRVLLTVHKRVIIFYNYNFELDILRSLSNEIFVAEWNGKRHDPLPDGDRWAYLVQYAAGAEGWNCITCDTIIFYSLNYSYKIMEQAKGRIDRVNTPYKNLYYYSLISKAPIDLGIMRALKAKKNFNERRWVK